MKTFAVLVLLVAAAYAASFASLVQEEEWVAFKLEHKKQYSAVEDELRKKTFLENKIMVAQHNQLYERGLSTFRLKINRFSDMLHSEFARFDYDNSNSSAWRQKARAAIFIPPANLVLPREVDWRKEGAVTGVKDEGNCSCSWAFSATGALEAQMFRASGTLVPLSEQNLIDCSTGQGNKGCSTGTMSFAFQYVRDNNGIDAEDKYPYEAKQKSCRYSPANSAAGDVGYVEVPIGNELSLAAAVANIGPMAAAVDASHKSFSMYADGIYYEADCDKFKVNQAVLVVGYGTEEGGDYWLVKNSEGTSWGDSGYIKMARNRDNNCGIATVASYPLLGQLPPRPHGPQ